MCIHIQYVSQIRYIILIYVHKVSGESERMEGENSACVDLVHHHLVHLGFAQNGCPHPEICCTTANRSYVIIQVRSLPGLENSIPQNSMIHHHVSQLQSYVYCP